MTPTSSPAASNATQRHSKIQKAQVAAVRGDRRRSLRNWLAAAVAVVLALGGLYAIFRAQADSNATAAEPGDYQVGSPGPGEPAPDFALTAAAGDEVALSDFQGQNVLLYFHEGLGCQACWDQIRDLEAAEAELDAAGIDELVSITSAPTDLLAQKMRDDGLQSLALADPELSVIREYDANEYGMMGDTRAGHTFILVGPDGTITWRADYGGAPDYTMYLPVDKILTDLQAGRVDT